MTIRSDSYSSTAEVTAYTRHLLDGDVAFGAESRPTVIEVEKFVDRASGVLNMAILAAGFTPATVSANSTAKLPLDDWVTLRAARMVELTQRGTGYDVSEGSRLEGFDSVLSEADEYIAGLAEGWKKLGIAVTDPTSQGFSFTALDKHSERSDPTSTTLEQPKFRRGKFDA